jgi:hypothetical protein
VIDQRHRPAGRPHSRTHHLRRSAGTDNHEIVCMV